MTCGRRRRVCRRTGSWRRPTRRTSPPSRCADAATSRLTSSTPWPRSRAARGESPTALARADRRQRSRRVRPVVSPVTPRKALGQHFLSRPEHPRRDRPPRGARRSATSCSRSVPGSACSPATSRSGSPSSMPSRSTGALEGPLSAGNRRLCQRAAALGRRAPARPRRARAGAGQDRRRTCPYNVATPVVAETIVGLPCVRSWCVMVQREVADRFFAVPSTKAYGAVSVLVQLTTRRTGLASRLTPRVPAASAGRLRARRLRAGRGAHSTGRGARCRRGGVRPSPQDARKLRSPSPAWPPASRLSPRSPSIGRDAAVRAEALAPDEFVGLEEALIAC